MRSTKPIQVFELVKRRHTRMEARKRTPSQRALQIGAIVLGGAGVAAATLALVALPFYVYLTASLPPIERLEDLLNPITGELLQPTRFYDSTGGTLILTLAPEGISRQFVNAADIPWLAEAYISSNQPDFWQENTLDLSEISLPPNTIAEHLVARLLFSSESEGWLKNIQTNLLAADAIEKYGRQQILAWALNSTDFGHWAFGAEGAAQLYFGKPAVELTLAESALLAAVAQAPALNPIDAPELAIRFQRLVLTAMREQGVITEAELTAAIADPLVFASGREPISLAPDFTDLAVRQLKAELGDQRVVNGGLEVTTTLDFALQQEISSFFSVGEQTNLAILDPINNRVLAAWGDTSTQHPAGGLMTPFIYLSAFAEGWSPASLVWDIYEEFPEGTTTLPLQSPVTLRQSLANGDLDATASLMQNLAIRRNINELVQIFNAGTVDITQEEFAITTLEAARMFSSLSQSGFVANKATSTANTLLFAADPNGVVEFDLTQTEWQPIISSEIAFLVTDILGDTTFWQLPTNINQASAIFKDSGQHWQIAYSPQRVVSVWTEEELDPESPLWPPFFLAAHRRLPMKDWDVPAGLTSVVVCVPSGQRPDDDCPETRREWFVRGSEPTETDSLYERIAINSLNGKLATVFTPEEFIQERVFLMVPSSAEAWVRATGIPLPPQDYDPVPAFTSVEGLPIIAEPEPFSQVSGVVEILGSLRADAVGYDVQVGQGLRPSEWQQIAEGRALPRSGILTQWNTEGLNGVWAIQLQVWDAEGRITRAYSVITIGGQ